MGNEDVAIYYVSGRKIHVIACWDNTTPKDEYDFYDIYENGICLNEGSPFYSMPTREEVREFINQ